MSTGELTSYGELAQVIENLPLLVREKRRREGMSLRTAAADSGVHFMTLRRFELGENAAMSSVVCLLRWLDKQGTAA